MYYVLVLNHFGDETCSQEGTVVNGETLAFQAVRAMWTFCNVICDIASDLSCIIFICDLLATCICRDLDRFVMLKRRDGQRSGCWRSLGHT